MPLLFFDFVFRSNPISYINENVDREHIREFLQSITDEIHIAGTAQDYAYSVRVRACVRAPRLCVVVEKGRERGAER